MAAAIPTAERDNVTVTLHLLSIRRSGTIAFASLRDRHDAYHRASDSSATPRRRFVLTSSLVCCAATAASLAYDSQEFREVPYERMKLLLRRTWATAPARSARRCRAPRVALGRFLERDAYPGAKRAFLEESVSEGWQWAREHLAPSRPLPDHRETHDQFYQRCMQRRHGDGRARPLDRGTRRQVRV